jgi:peptidoglycan hydrolase CwlO-like protein
MALHETLRSMVLGVALLGASLAVVAATPPASHQGTQAAKLRTQLQGVDAKLAAAHAHNTALQSQVAQMEQRNAAKQKQLQQRDAEIAALQQKLRAAGVPVSATSAGR